MLLPNDEADLLPAPDSDQDTKATRVAVLDPVRRLVFDRYRELHLTGVDLSRRIGRNNTYVTQWLFRGHPKELPEDVRIAMANYLDLDPEALRQKPLPTLPPATRRDAAARSSAQMPRLAPAPAISTVPVFSDTGKVKLDDFTAEQAVGPAGVHGTVYGIWISQDCGRLRAGDLAFVRPALPPRVGDSVVVLDELDEIVAVGDLVALDAERYTVEGHGRSTSDSRARRRIQKIFYIGVA